MESRSRVRVGRYRERKERGGWRQQIKVGEREIVCNKEERWGGRQMRRGGGRGIVGGRKEKEDEVNIEEEEKK